MQSFPGFAVLMMAGAASAVALGAKTPPSIPKLSYSLAGVVDDDKSFPFACSFGTYEVQNANKTSRGTEATLKGTGILMNSGQIHHPVSQNPEITYRFPPNVTVTNGLRLSVVCNDSSTDEDHKGVASVRYFIPHRPSR